MQIEKEAFFYIIVSFFGFLIQHFTGIYEQ